MKFDFIKFIIRYVKKHHYNRYFIKYPNKKYKLELLIKELLYLLKSGVSWRYYRGPINWHTLYWHFMFFKYNDIFKNVYIELLDNYYKRDKTSKLRYQIIDSSFIQNQYGIDKIGRNKYFKNKNVSKLSLITDVNGIPISVILNKGTIYDTNFVSQHMNDMLFVTKTNQYKNTKNKHNFLADAGYDSKIVRSELSNIGYNVIIAHNRRNTKDPTKIKKLNEHDKLLYKKRIKIENVFAWIKKSKRLSMRYDKFASSYLAFTYLALIQIISKKI